jgi:hypothetical protein
LTEAYQAIAPTQETTQHLAQNAVPQVAKAQILQIPQHLMPPPSEQIAFPPPQANKQANPMLLDAHLAATGGKIITRFPPEPNVLIHLLFFLFVFLFCFVFVV